MGRYHEGEVDGRSGRGDPDSARSSRAGSRVLVRCRDLGAHELLNRKDSRVVGGRADDGEHIARGTVTYLHQVRRPVAVDYGQPSTSSGCGGSVVQGPTSLSTSISSTWKERADAARVAA